MVTAQPVTRTKRDRLIEAAKAAFYQQGFAPTTLADIAARAEVPLGNVYYYFRTKDEILAAVIAAHLGGIRARFAQWDQKRLSVWQPRTGNRQEGDASTRAGGPVAPGPDRVGCRTVLPVG